MNIQEIIHQYHIYFHFFIISQWSVLKTFFLYTLGTCHKQQCVGYRHYSNSFRDSLRVRDIKECSDRCAVTSYCNTFSFKHYSESSGELNCLLSAFSSFRLDTTRDLSTDINWTLYKRKNNAQCSNNGNDRQDNYYGRGKNKWTYKLDLIRCGRQRAA